MCKRLAKMAAGFASGSGNSLTALERRGMVEESGRNWPYSYNLTELGERAIEEARREGF